MTTSIFNESDLAILDQTQAVRKQIIDDLTREGKLPETKGDREFLLSALDGADRAVLGKARINADIRTASAQRQVASTIAGLLLARSRKNSEAPLADPTAPFDLDPNEIVAGETDIGTVTLSYNSFSQDT